MVADAVKMDLTLFLLFVVLKGRDVQGIRSFRLERGLK
jgi:hypothetical protein